MAKIKQGLADPDKFFNLDGLDYKQGIWEIFYGSKELDSQGEIKKDIIRVGIRNQTDTSYILQHPIKVSEYLDDSGAAYNSLDTLILDLSVLLGFNKGGGSGSGIEVTQNVNQFNDLVVGTNAGDIAYVQNPQGTRWLPASMGGTYYPAGWYLWTGTEWVSDRNAIADQLEQNILAINDNDTDILQLKSKVIDTEVVIKEASDFGVIDSSKIYVIDGLIDMGSTQIEVPSTGIFIKGLDYFVSSIFSNEDNYTMFVNASGQAAGNVRMNNVELYTTGVNSQVFNLDNEGNFGAIEFQSCNFGSFSSQQDNLGILSNYRQFRVNDCAFIRVLEGITFSGTWAGGFRIGDSILLSIPANANIFKEGTSLVFQGSSFTDVNAISIDSTSVVFDFQESNFLIDEGFEIDGARFRLNSNPIPNLSETSTKVLFRGRGIKNTFSGGRWEVTTQVLTPLTVGVQTKALGTTTYDSMVHFSQTVDNAFVYDSTIEKDFIVTGQLVVDGGANDEIDVIIRKWDNSISSYVDIRTFTRNISNVLGGLDIAYFDPYAPVILNENDRIEVWLRNNTDGTDATLLEGSFLALNVRN